MISNGSPAANGIANRNEYEHNIKDNEQIFNEPCKTGTKWCNKPPGWASIGTKNHKYFLPVKVIQIGSVKGTYNNI